MQVIKEDLVAVQPAVTECRHLAEQMSTLSGLSGDVAVQKRLYDLDAAIEEIEEGIENRETELNKALKRAEQCSNCLQVIIASLTFTIGLLVLTLVCIQLLLVFNRS